MTTPPSTTPSAAPSALTALQIPKARARARAKLADAGVIDPFYTLADYREFFLQSGFPMEVKEAKFRRGLRYYMEKLAHGVTYARYAFVATKPNRS